MQQTPTRVALDDLNLEEAQRRLCRAALAVGGSRKEAAELLGVSPGRLATLLRRLGLEQRAN